MDEKTLFDRYSRYLETIKKIGSYSLSKNLTLKELEIPSSDIQSGYKDMKKFDFKGNIIDYFCWLSTNYIAHYWQKDTASYGHFFFEPLLSGLKDYKAERKDQPSTEKNTLQISEFINKKLEKTTENLTIEDLTEHLIGLFWNLADNLENARNLTRLFLKKPDYFFSLINLEKFDRSEDRDELKYFIYMTISGFRFADYQAEKNDDEVGYWGPVEMFMPMIYYSEMLVKGRSKHETNGKKVKSPLKEA